MSKSVFDFAKSRLTGKDVKKIRQRLNISQDRLSKLLELSLSTIAQWETNRRKISRENQAKLLEMCGYADDLGTYLDGECQKTNGCIDR